MITANGDAMLDSQAFPLISLSGKYRPLDLQRPVLCLLVEAVLYGSGSGYDS